MRRNVKIRATLAAMAFFILAAWFIDFFFIKSNMGKPLPGGSNSFVVGVNYPWVNYGNDFGDGYWGHEGVSTDQTAQTVDHDFAELQKAKVTEVRWFLWANGQAGIHFNQDGTVSGLDQDFYLDMDRAIEIAQRHNIRIIFVLVDFKFFEGEPYGKNGHNWGGHALLVTSTHARQSFIDNAVRPLVQRYANERTIAAWEVANEPEWEIGKSIRWGRKNFRAAQMQAFIGSVVTCIHSYSHQPVTVGSLSPSFLMLWKKVGLDFYEAHSYPYTEVLEPLPLSAASFGLSKPILLGEFPSANSNRSTGEYLDEAYKSGYSGAFVWSYRANDKYSDFAGSRKEIQEWIKRH